MRAEYNTSVHEDKWTETNLNTGKRAAESSGYNTVAGTYINVK